MKALRARAAAALLEEDARIYCQRAKYTGFWFALERILTDLRFAREHEAPPLWLISAPFATADFAIDIGRDLLHRRLIDLHRKAYVPAMKVAEVARNVLFFFCIDYSAGYASRASSCRSWTR
jgi:hypothetical protein